MAPTEAKREIESKLEGDALDYWNGAAPDLVNEFVIQAQREGIDAAVAAVEVCAEPDPKIRCPNCGNYAEPEPDQHGCGCHCEKCGTTL